MKKTVKILTGNASFGAQPPTWHVGALSEKGPVRAENQDRMCGLEVKLGRVFIVADGMGGHKGGARAAQMAIEALSKALRKADPGLPIPATLQSAFAMANRQVHRQACSGNDDTRRMGATAVLLLIRGNTAYVAHVGDSRAYLYRNGRLQRLTRDHTRAESMVAAGILTPEQAREHPGSSMLERAVGIDPDIHVEISKGSTVKAGDSFLLCSDGLSGFASDAEMQSLIETNLPADQLPGRLYKLALEKGSDDNITIQYIKRVPGMPQPTRSNRSSKTAALIIGIGLLAALAFYQQFFSTEARLNARLAQTERSRKTVLNELDKLRGEKVKSETQLEELRNQQAALNQQISKLKNKMAELSNTIQTAEQKKKDHEATIDDLTKQIGQLDDPP